MTGREHPLVLLVDGSASDRSAIRRQIEQQYRVAEASTIESATQLLESAGRVSLLLTNHQLPDGAGLQMLDEAMGHWPPVPVIFMIDKGGAKAAAAALQQGAADFVIKESTWALRLTQVLGNALARSRAEASARRRAREMGALNVILTALNRAMDEEPVLDTIVEEVNALMGTDACSVILVDKDSDRMFLRAATNLPARDMVLPVPLSKSIAGRVVREKKGCITHDVTQDPDWHSLEVDYTVRSMLTVPLVDGGQAIGVLQAINKSVGPFLPSDLSLIKSIAVIATAAIARGRQFTQTQETLQKKAEQTAEFERLGKAILEQVDTLEAALAPAAHPQIESIRQRARQLLE